MTMVTSTLAKYKVPKQVIVVDDLPTSGGRV
jgi:hypothetical protein